MVLGSLLRSPVMSDGTIIIIGPRVSDCISFYINTTGGCGDISELILLEKCEWVNESFYASASNLSLRGFCDSTGKPDVGFMVRVVSNYCISLFLPTHTWVGLFSLCKKTTTYIQQSRTIPRSRADVWSRAHTMAA